MTTVAIAGATTWGNTIARLLARKKIATSVWAKTEEKARILRDELHDASSDDNYVKYITFSNIIADVLKSADFVIWAVPAQNLRGVARQFHAGITDNMILVNLAKGLEADTGKRMSEILSEEIASISPERICVLSGPNLSKEINLGLPATSVVASIKTETAEKARELFNAPNFHVFTSSDLIGVELCGALKNVVALGAGMVDGLELGDNAKATFITLGWDEVVLLGTALGAMPATFFGLAGIGDLITTCAGNLSRNHYVGYQVAQGKPLHEVKAAMSHIAEGIDTTIAAHSLAHSLRFDAPIINMVYSVLFDSLPPAEIMVRFRNGLKPEARV
jgi:glycerol-3-phosphate dehydrogenase (NAD(P)+)